MFTLAIITTILLGLGLVLPTILTISGVREMLKGGFREPDESFALLGSLFTTLAIGTALALSISSIVHFIGHP